MKNQDDTALVVLLIMCVVGYRDGKERFDVVKTTTATTAAAADATAACTPWFTNSFIIRRLVHFDPFRTNRTRSPSGGDKLLEIRRRFY